MLLTAEPFLYPSPAFLRQDLTLQPMFPRSSRCNLGFSQTCLSLPTLASRVLVLESQALIYMYVHPWACTHKDASSTLWMKLVKITCSRNEHLQNSTLPGCLFWGNISPPASYLEGERNEAWPLPIRKAFLGEARRGIILEWTYTSWWDSLYKPRLGGAYH